MKKEGLVSPHSIVTLCPQEIQQKTRIDRYLTEQFPLYSRSFFKKLIDEGFVSVNDAIISKQSCIISPQDTVTVRFPGERSITGDTIIARNLSIEIIAEHEHFYIINKPAGLIVHPPKTNSGMVTLMDWLLHHDQELQEVGYIDRPGIVHRLDKDTSGLMIIPRTNCAHKQFSDLFKDRKIQKTYLALVHGHPEKQGIIEYPIGRHPQQRMKMYAYPEIELSPREDESTKRIRSATTHYQVLEYYKDSSLVEAKPVTGRTHQIRVHLAAIGHPIIGDPVYGTASKIMKRHALHAAGISFNFLDTAYTYTLPLPADIQALVSHVQKQV